MSQASIGATTAAEPPLSFRTLPRLNMSSVSIQIAVHDRLEHLRPAVASALAQQWDELEVLLIDDGSGAETRSWLSEIAESDCRVRLVRQEHLGVAQARQTGLIASSAAFVCILDSDDLLAPDAIGRIMACFGDDPSLDLVYTNNLHVRPDGTTMQRRYPHYACNEAMIRATFLSPIVPFKHSGTTFRRAVAVALGGYDTGLEIKVDVDLFLRFLAAGRRLRLLEEPLVHFRLHAASMSHRRRWAGVRTWARLVDRYRGHRPVLERLYLKAARASLESAKLAYATFRLR